jgi:hypothetical protein
MELIMIAFFGTTTGVLAGIIAWATEHKRVGGIRFWRLGRLGGSFYVAKKTRHVAGD